ncbi:hypothetical protein PC111_g5864 [Phytophthora cactorum]|nr:hypothetical protein PC111_g5864 [Phytophthora cactorum]KAG2917319.1 hypothetical protein PC114_g7163 [Phytophthora cactorum]KAG3026045.1 hypothetical protein PC120_g6119 [Phytophthora cactorum]KAG3179412.1 hypothetical protein C6341_g7503 [Phytophthora cactorum]
MAQVHALRFDFLRQDCDANQYRRRLYSLKRCSQKGKKRGKLKGVCTTDGQTDRVVGYYGVYERAHS